MPRSFELVRFIPGHAEHMRFIYDSFRRSINVWPWSHVNVTVLMDRLKRELATPGTDTRIACPHGMGDSFIGWYSCRPREDTLVYGFTKYRLRRSGIATVALESMGIDFNRPVWLRFWTPAAARIVAKQSADLIFDTRGAWDA